MYVSISEMRHRVTILRPDKITDNEGNIVTTNTPEQFTVWAKVLPAASKISNGYMERVNEVSYKIVIRYRSDISVEDTLLWDGKILVQTAPPYLMDGIKKYLVLECVEMVEDGG